MDKWTTLEPVKLHSSTLPSITGLTSSKNPVLARAASHQNRAQYIGVLPSDLHLLILSHLAIPDIPNYARTNRALSRLVRDGGDSKIWKERLAVLRRIGRPLSCFKTGEQSDYDSLLAELGKRHRVAPKLGHKKESANGSSSSIDLSDFGRFVSSPPPPPLRQSPPPRMPLEVDDDFGDFASAPPLYGLSPSPFGAPQAAAMSPNLHQSYQTPLFPSSPLKPTSQLHQPIIPSPLGLPQLAPTALSKTTGSFTKQPTPQDVFIHAHELLRPLLTYLVPATPPHQLLTRLFPPEELPPQPLKHRSKPSLISTTDTSARKPWPSETYFQAMLLHLITLWLGDRVKGVRKDKTVISDQILRGAVDRFEVAMLKDFEDADGRVDEWGMREASWCAWEVWEWRDYIAKPGTSKTLAGPSGNGLVTATGLIFGGGIGSTGEVTSAVWEVGKVWIERREVFYETGRWDPNLNFTCVSTALPGRLIVLYIF
jgi:recyclin-1